MRRSADNPAPCACDWCAENHEICGYDPQECRAGDADAHDEAMQEMWD